MTAYYNEIDPYAAQWLRNLIAAGHIAPGHVDTRSIEDVTPADLAGYVQCHFFAGIGVWSHALRAAGWPDDRPVWTGSCPCQPFSAAGKGAGLADERHLWPALHWLIDQCRPPVAFGEQVASKDGLAWLDLVCADLEGAGYAVGAVDSCAAGYGAPHLRQRLYWVADANHERCAGESVLLRQGARGPAAAGVLEAPGRGEALRLGDADDVGGGRHSGAVPGAEGGAGRPVRGIANGAQPPGPVGGAWADAEWLACSDGKARPAKPGAFPLAYGAPSRVGRLRAYGNAIVAPQAEEFIRAYLSASP